MSDRNARSPAVAGLFYPGEPELLARTVDGLLQEAATDVAGRRPKVLVVPHAGYAYSGSTAARAYASLAPWRAEIRRVLLLGPSHRAAFIGVALPSQEVFATPLGEVRLDRAAMMQIRAIPGVSVLDAAHEEEHSLEVQLPFLQRCLPDFSLVPLSVGHSASETIAAVLDTLWGGPETLVVVSTDLSHYHAWHEARARDADTAHHILALRGPLTSEQACGAAPLNGLFATPRRHALAGELLALCNSGDTAGDKRRVVGYCALSFTEHGSAPSLHAG